MAYKNKEDALAYAKKYREENAEKRKKQAKQYYKENHKKIHKYQKQYREDNREQIRESGKQYRGTEKGRENARKASIKYSYGLFYEEWLEMWESQNEKCAICGESFLSPSNACIDHNHKTNEIRGLLCRKCNAAIGLLNDNPELLKKAIEYLKV